MESQPSHHRTPPQGGAAEEKPAAGEPPRPAPVRGRGGCRGTTQGEDDVFVWRVEDGARRNYDRLGAELAARGAPLYRNQTDGHGLLLAPPGGKARLITRATQLAPVLVDLLPLEVRKEGKAVGEFPAAAALNAMLCSEQFLRHFLAVDRVAPTPVYGKDFSLLRPGYNDGGPGARVLYLGPEPRVEASTETVNRFLDVMHFAGNADRTNAVAAALTVLLRDHWPGSKPAVVITATRSHAGKGTVAEFIRGAVGKADILYEGVDWPLQHQFQKQLRADPDIGLVYLDNVRLDSAGGRPRFIRSAFVEGFVTTPAHTLASPGAGEPLSLQNRYVVVLNTNEGTLSPDLMNRALPIHLDPRGDIQERRSPIGNPRLEFLPQHQGLLTVSNVPSRTTCSRRSSLLATASRRPPYPPHADPLPHLQQRCHVPNCPGRRVGLPHNGGGGGPDGVVSFPSPVAETRRAPVRRGPLSRKRGARRQGPGRSPQNVIF
jgi:hypothetical protein